MPAAALTHKTFLEALRAIANPEDIKGIAKFFSADPNGHSSDNKILGVSPGSVFPVAKQFTAMPLAEVELLLDSPYYEARLGAVSIMDFKARAKRITDEERLALYELYLRRHDRINNWDLVDRAAPHVVGGYLNDKPRKILTTLAKSTNPWERRTAIVCTYYFIRNGDTADTFKIARLLVHDPHPLVQKAVGSWLREAGKKDLRALLAFLEDFSDTMPRTTFRYAVEKLGAEQRAKLLA
jgi:3-methyladenine DNA glycosylase AlkD